MAEEKSEENWTGALAVGPHRAGLFQKGAPQPERGRGVHSSPRQPRPAGASWGWGATANSSNYTLTAGTPSGNSSEAILPTNFSGFNTAKAQEALALIMGSVRPADPDTYSSCQARQTQPRVCASASSSL